MQASPGMLGADEFQDVGMVGIEDAHIGTPATAALLDLFGGGIKNPDKAHRA